MNWNQRTWEQQERVRSIPAKKDRRRWCRGKVGVEHVTEVRRVVHGGTELVCRMWPWGKYPHWICHHQTVCTRCGKILRYSLDRCPDRTTMEEETHDRATDDR